MNNDSNNNVVTDELLAKYLAGEAEPQEAMDVDAWVAASDAQQRVFNNLFDVFQATAAKPYEKPDISSIWQQVAALFTHTPTTRKMRRGWLMAAAAAIAVLVTTGLYLQFRPQPVALQTAVAGAGTIKNMQLADGTKAVLNTGSQLRYPASFTADSRKVQLTGEAYFEVAGNAAAPFVVEGNGVSIKVLGTAFNTAANDSTVVAEVYEGRVMLYNDYGKVIAGAGQTGVYYKLQHRFQLLPRVNKNSSAYATARFYFENDSLPTICEVLSKACHKKIMFREPALASLKMSSVFENQSLDYILEVIAATLNIQYTYEDTGTVVFTKE